METVYNFSIYSIGIAAMVGQPQKCTEESIQRMGGVIIPDTAEVVDVSLIDGDGRYTPERMRRMD